MGNRSIKVFLVLEFSNMYFIKLKKKDVKDNKISADNYNNSNSFLNIVINEEAIKNTNTDKLRSFLVEQGVDYVLVDNAFGWHELMLVLFNMNLIVSKQIITPKDKIDVYDSPTKFLTFPLFAFLMFQ